MENGTIKKTSLYLPEDWQEWLREVSKCTGKSMQSIIFEALKQWREGHIEDIERKIAALELEHAAQRARLIKDIESAEAAEATKRTPKAEPKPDATPSEPAASEAAEAA